ncbi:MAG: hypothetical protein ACN6RK_06625, partial [Stenotrophomonas sp.]
PKARPHRRAFCWPRRHFLFCGSGVSREAGIADKTGAFCHLMMCELRGSRRSYKQHNNTPLHPKKNPPSLAGFCLRTANR